ncbi:pectinesterase family protein [Paenibacillus sp. P26]|nr:pectinesterase family protein [Paenibacillus sp. P26]
MNKRFFSIMRVTALSTLLLAALTPHVSADTVVVNPTPPTTTLPTKGYYNVIDPELPGKLLNALNHRTPATTDGTLRDSAPVIVAAHRGVVDADHPENTIESAVNTMNAGIEAMELDVYETADHVPYLMHDKTLKRMLGPGYPQYADIHRWEKDLAQGKASQGDKPPAWSTIANVPICTNGADGYGMTDDHPTCKSANIYPATLEQTLQKLYSYSYQGFVFLDLRETGNVVDVAAQLAHDNADASNNDYGAWVANHVVLKFQTVLFNGPSDYANQVKAYYQQKYAQTLDEFNLALLYVQPVYASNSTTTKDNAGTTAWAIADFASWERWFMDKDLDETLISPLIGLKAKGAVLNYNNDDLFTQTWHDGRSVGVYIPKRLCSRTLVADANYLAGTDGTWWEGGVCGPLTPAMNTNEFGDCGKYALDVSGGGCTDHRMFKEWWHDTAKFGFLITDTPVDDINYLMQFPGQRPNTTMITTNRDQLPSLRVAADGSGDYTTIAAAVNALPATGGNIQVAPGIYKEKSLISKNNVGLFGTGTDASKVKITYNDYGAKINPANGKPYGTSGSATVTVTGTDFYATNLTIENTADYEAPNFEANAQAVALLSKGDRAVYRAVMVLGGQDTLYVNNKTRAYFNNSYVEGYVDYIFGNGKAVFDNSTIKAKVHTDLHGEVTITAQSRASASEDSGFVFNNNTILFDDTYMDNVWLGRPWGAYSTTYFLNTKMGWQVKTPGWIEFVPAQYATAQIPATNKLPTSTYREYKTLYPLGAAAGRLSILISGNRPQRNPTSR